MDYGGDPYHMQSSFDAYPDLGLQPPVGPMEPSQTSEFSPSTSTSAGTLSFNAQDLVASITPDMLRSLNAITQRDIANMKQALEVKNKKEALIGQIKGLLSWDSIQEDIRKLLPEEFLASLADWVLNCMQPDVVRQCCWEQSKKEQEFYKKREDLVHKQQKDINTARKSYLEALNDCDLKNTPHRKPIVAKQNEEEFQKLLLKQKDELFSLDRKIVAAIDHLLNAQQKRFAEIGIPGMKESLDPGDVLQQIIVLDAICKLAGVDTEVDVPL